MQRKNRAEYYSKRGSLTEDLFLRLNRSEADGLAKGSGIVEGLEASHSGRRPSYPFVNGSHVDLNETNSTSIDCRTSSPTGRRSSSPSGMRSSSPGTRSISPSGIRSSSPSVRRSSSPIRRSSSPPAMRSSSPCNRRTSLPCDSMTDLTTKGVDSDTNSSCKPTVVLRNSSTSNLDFKGSESAKSREFSRSRESSKSRLEDDRNWRVCEEDLKRYADEVREQNRALEEMRLSGQQEAESLRQR